MKRWQLLWQWLGLLLLASLSLQLFFAGRIALMVVLDLQSTSFERSQAWGLAHSAKGLVWRQSWVPYAALPDNLKRAVIVSEDDLFAQHHGVRWEALEKAWQRNARAQAQARQNRPAKMVGGSTITQQLAKNLFLSGERTLWRKSQEFVLTVMLEALLDKRRILEIYLNHVEWGEGVFGAEAAAQHYFQKPAAQLQAWEAARLVVMLPRPKYFERLPNSSYLQDRTEVILSRMASARLP